MLYRHWRIGLLPLLFGALPVFAADGYDLPEKVRFNRDIRPIFSHTCFVCHGPDKNKRKARLRLDVREDALADRKGTSPIVPGDPDSSEAYQLIIEPDPDDRMPPAEFNKQLTPRQIALVKKWIQQGAVYEKHWSFIPPKRPAAPEVKHADRVRNPIDTFVFVRLEREGLSPSAEADRRTLIRRVTLDLTGLLPTSAEVDAFVKDKSEEAYEMVVDKLLASPRYGEHMTRYWLDAARYADTSGYQYDRERRQWVWRDWVIHALNTNKPFDRFTIEQIAGDLLPDATDQTRLATGFHRNHPITIEGGVIDEEYRTEYVIDRVVTTSTVWLAQTFLCARCHDHKYDPISQDDFYSFYSFFNNVPERGLNGFDPKRKIASPLTDGRATELDRRIAETQKSFDAAAKNANVTPARFEAKLRAEFERQWQSLAFTQMLSTGGATLKQLPDRRVLATGSKPASDTYEVTFTVNARELRAIRLEALTHRSHANKSTGRGSNGNFVLSEFEVWAAAASGDAFTRMKIGRAEADYAQKNYPISAAIDGTGGRTGWAVDGNTKHENRTAIFTLTESIGVGSTVRVRMVHEYGGSHQIGHFRLSKSADGRTPTPLSVMNTVMTPPNKRNAKQKAALQNYLIGRYGGPELARLSGELSRLRADRERTTDKVPETMVLTEMPKPRQAYVLERGEYDKPIKERPVTAGVPVALGVLRGEAPKNRLGLAQWLVARDQPLTARVTVNRYWQQLFGVGLVKSSEDFGAQGDWPSHPELLDWLAVEFMDNGWDIKAILKTIVMSSTYRQSSHVTRAMQGRDPENRLLARGPRLRLDGEVIRDAALGVAGLLDEKIGGPSVYPYHPKGLWLETNNRKGYSRPYPHPMHREQLYRRSMYTFWKRTVPPPSLSTFDAPEREYCVVRRSRTNTPLQAFVMLHDPQFVEAARHLGERMIKDGGNSIEKRIAHGFMLVTSRDPHGGEMALLSTAFDQRLAQYKQDAAAAKKLLSVGESARDESLDLAEHAAYTQVARLLLNLSEFVTKG